MAEILIKGATATVEITQDDDGEIEAACIEHEGRMQLVQSVPRLQGCGWTWAESNNWNDVMQTPDIERHADEGV